ncbi:hypothetical protein [Aeromonas hydrophila]|uniref:hypothetical protein n=1 Tax=Aeromonas hydrophila TaxID=644 RepID=UPI001455800E|nr:hypothetical protein [Aeromonas hydrophila]NLR35232.1 hypothetical protein [Aeromonas hydrophila]
MAAQFIDLAREIIHSPFPNQLRSVTWLTPLVGVSHVPDQSNTAGKVQQTGGWNSGAVALPAHSIAHSLTVALLGGNGCAKKGVKRTHSASKDGM